MSVSLPSFAEKRISGQEESRDRFVRRIYKSYRT